MTTPQSIPKNKRIFKYTTTKTDNPNFRVNNNTKKIYYNEIATKAEKQTIWERLPI
jgi:hypothetical protein